MSNLISGISILLIFAVFFLEMVETKVKKIISQPKPTKDENNLKKDLQADFIRTIWGRCVPLVIGLLFLSYILLPTSINIILQSRLSLWNFDPTLTLYVVINIGLFILTGISINQLRRMVKRYNEVFSSNS